MSTAKRAEVPSALRAAGGDGAWEQRPEIHSGDGGSSWGGAQLGGGAAGGAPCRALQMGVGSGVSFCALRAAVWMEGGQWDVWGDREEEGGCGGTGEVTQSGWVTNGVTIGDEVTDGVTTGDEVTQGDTAGNRQTG